MSRMIRLLIFFLSLCAGLVVTGTGAMAQRASKEPRVAIFFEPDFPYYGVNPRTSPQEIAKRLGENRVHAELLGEEALSDTTRFHADKFAALVLPYGNTYPDKAFAAMRAFHRAGGALDQIIAAKGSVFWITGTKAQHLPGAKGLEETDEIKALMTALPLGATVRGFWWYGEDMGINEGPGVSMASRFGKVTVVSDYVANFSVLSGVQMEPLKQKPQAPPPALDRSKVYFSFTMSDGDNLCTWRDYFRRYFEDPLHGKIPIGWGMGPTLLDNAPV
jgi:hypothetical protein